MLWADMAYVWVQQWVALPVIAEEQMGDTSGQSGFPPFEGARAGLAQDGSHSLSKLLPTDTVNPTLVDPRPSGSNVAFHAQYSTIPQSQQRFDNARLPIQQGSGPQNHSFTHEPTGSFNMSAMARALPDYSSPTSNQSLPHQQALRGLSGASTPALVYQLQQISQFPGQAASYAAQGGFNASYTQSQYSAPYVQGQGVQLTAYNSFNPNATRSAGPNPSQQSYPSFPLQASPYYYMPPPYATQGQPSQSFSANTQPAALFGRTPSFPTGQGALLSHSVEGGLRSGVMAPASRTMHTAGIYGDYSALSGMQG